MSRFDSEFDPPGPDPIGLIVLQSDETIEREMRAMLPADLDLYATRVPSAEDVSADTLQAMEGKIAAAARLFPRGVAFRAIGYGCTSGTAQIGAARVAGLVRDGAPTKAVTQPVDALIAAAAALGLRRLAFLSPYVEDVSDRLRSVLAGGGVETPAFGTFAIAEEAKVARISTASIVDAAARLVDGAAVDGVILSCTNLRTLTAIPLLEARLGLPVLSSNQALAWRLASLAGRRADGPGVLMNS